jgi:RNA polymerase sigma factor (sigma-70 family)
LGRNALGLSKVNKGLKGYRYQEVEIDDEEDQETSNTVDYETHKKYIDRIVRRFIKDLPPNSRWDKDEFTSEAWLALCKCADKYYNPDYNDNLMAYAYPYIIKRLSEFMSVNMYSLKARYYNVKNNEKTFAKINWLERTIWTESQKSNGGGDDDSHDNPLLSKPSGIVSIVDEAGNKEEVDIIQEIVNEELPDRERRAIVRRFRDGESYREIGKKLNVTHETARRLVIRGLKTLKQKAQNAGINRNKDL